jgi:hypothetical protein
MVKAYWLAAALVVGITLGLLIGRGADEETGTAAAQPQAGVPAEQRPVTRAPEHDPRASREDPQPIATFTPSDTVVLQPAMPPATITSTPRDPSAAISSNVENAPPGFVPGSGTPEHHEFLREARDDSWAYLREAEIENALLAETSTGKFRKDRIECRTTMCEVNLSARGETQVAALKKWYQEFSQLQNTRPSPTLDMLWVTLAEDPQNGKATASVVYTRPQQRVPPRN